MRLCTGSCTPYPLLLHCFLCDNIQVCLNSPKLVTQRKKILILKELSLIIYMPSSFMQLDFQPLECFDVFYIFQIPYNSANRILQTSDEE